MYVLSNKETLATELRKVNKLKCPCEDSSVPLGREKKELTSGEGRRDLERKVAKAGEWDGGRQQPDMIFGSTVV